MSDPTDPFGRSDLPREEISGGAQSVDDDAQGRHRPRTVWATAGIVAAVAIAGAAVLTSGHGHLSGGSTATGADGALLAATSASPSPSPSNAPRHPGPNRVHGFGGPDLDGGPAFGGAQGRLLHGEATVSNPNGGTQIVDTQQGTISKLDAAAKTVTVTSSDKVSFTYVVDSNTRLIDFAASNPGQATFSNLKTGDTVRIVAVRNGDTRTATSLVDGTPTGKQGGHGGPRFAPPSATPSAGSSASGASA